MSDEKNLDIVEKQLLKKYQKKDRKKKPKMKISGKQVIKLKKIINKE